jgi:virginiamycin B lyase
MATQESSKLGAVPGVTVPGSVQIDIKEWSLPTPDAMPDDAFSSKRDGSGWYSAQRANLLGRFDPKTSKFEQFNLRPGSDPESLLEHAGSGVQTTVYFTSRTGGFIGEFDPNTRDVREFRIHGPKSVLHDLAFDPNGVVWFTVLKAQPPRFPQGSEVGVLNLFSSEIRLAHTPTQDASPYSLALNSKGIPVFTELDSAKLGSIDPVTMKITEYSLPNADARARCLTIAPDDVIWYTDYVRGYLGRFDPQSGEFKEWPSPTGQGSHPFAITNTGKAIWYFETGSQPNMLVRFDPDSQKFQSWPVKAGGNVDHLYAHTDGSLWFASPVSNSIVRVTTDAQAK